MSAICASEKEITPRKRTKKKEFCMIATEFIEVVFERSEIRPAD